MVLYTSRSHFALSCCCSVTSPLQCVLIMANLWNVGDVGIRKRVLTLLHQKSLTLASVRAVLAELHANIGDNGAHE